MNTPNCLDKMTPEQQSEVLADLGDWVQWMTRNYLWEHREDLKKWHLHPGLTRELLALKDAWAHAYEPGAPGNAALLWHQDLQRFADHVGDYHRSLWNIEEQHRRELQEQLQEQESKRAEELREVEPPTALRSPALQPPPGTAPELGRGGAPTPAVPTGRRFRPRRGP